MHPNPGYAWTDEAAMLAFVARASFCTIFVPGPGGGAVVHAPVTVDGRSLRFHLARANRATAMLEGATALVSCLGPDSYVSADWYGTADQVPTWNDVAIEGAGPVRRLNDADLVQQIDALGAAHEARLAPKPAWTRDGMAPARFDAMVRALWGYEIALTELRGTRKLGQHKSPVERRSAAAGVEAAGWSEMAEHMRAGLDPA